VCIFETDRVPILRPTQRVRPSLSRTCS
jgi:hypothetical protein